MGIDKTISLASSISILPESESFADSISILSDLPAFLIAVASDAPAHPNRAPPRIRGMGTTKTALLQRLAEKFETSYDTCFSVRFSDYAASNSSMSDFQNSP